MRRALLSFSCLLLLAACGKDAPSPEPMTESGSMVQVSDKAVIYAEYSQRAVKNTKGSILFFSKPSDPFSVRSDTVLQGMYAAGEATVPTYRVDFASGTGARLTYGVVVEDTFVLLDGAGKRVMSFIHPTAEEIKILVRGNIPSSPKK